MKKLYNKKMKSIKMIFLMVGIGMMLITSCSTENAELNTNEKTNSKELQFNRTIEELPDLGDGSWYSYVYINEVEYIKVNGIKAEEIINVVTSSCESCRAKCTYDSNLGGGVHFVKCDNGNAYYVQNCGDGWTVTVAGAYDSYSGSGSMQLTVAPPPC